jgi:hypothetical protein
MPRKRKPGRPKGSKNKSTAKRKAGRPKGAKTKRGVGAPKRRAFKNMTHMPKTLRGRPVKPAYWILDLYDINDNFLKTLISSFPTSKKAAEMEAAEFLGHHHGGKVVRSLTIAGPYKSRPSKTTARI